MEKCPLCKGRGMQVHIQQIGPGMVQQIQTVCVECKGQGERISPKDRCENCGGAKVTREKKIIEVHVEKGEAAQLRAARPLETLLGADRGRPRCPAVDTPETPPPRPGLPGSTAVPFACQSLLGICSLGINITSSLRLSSALRVTCP